MARRPSGAECCNDQQRGNGRNSCPLMYMRVTGLVQLTSLKGGHDETMELFRNSRSGIQRTKAQWGPRLRRRGRGGAGRHRGLTGPATPWPAN